VEKRYDPTLVSTVICYILLLQPNIFPSIYLKLKPIGIRDLKIVYNNLITKRYSPFITGLVYM
jgi:hypothetical protein